METLRRWLRTSAAMHGMFALAFLLFFFLGLWQALPLIIFAWYVMHEDDRRRRR